MSVTFKGEPKTLAGHLPKVGDSAPSFTLTGDGLKAITLDDVVANGSKNALLIVVPSLDTGVCSTEAQTFSGRLPELPADTVAYVVSMDLPFAQSRWAKEHGAEKLQMLSDFREHSFGDAYGVRIQELGLLARSIFLIGKNKRIRYVQLVPEVTSEPNYDEAIAAARA